MTVMLTGAMQTHGIWNRYRWYDIWTINKILQILGLNLRWIPYMKF